MKLTLAMGLQFDNGKQTSAIALSIGGDKQASMQAEQQPMEAVLVHAESVQAEHVQSEIDRVALNQAALTPVSKSGEPFFLTYNLKGLNDTLIFKNALIDVFA